VRDVRVIGPIVRLELCADGRPTNEPLEAEISRERFDAERFHVGQKVGVRFRRWQVYPADALEHSLDSEARVVEPEAAANALTAPQTASGAAA
jgi:hypothetical protein